MIHSLLFFLSFFLSFFVLARLLAFICPVWIELFGKIEGQDLFKHLRMRSDERMLFVVRPGKKNKVRAPDIRVHERLFYCVEYS